MAYVFVLVKTAVINCSLARFPLCMRDLEPFLDLIAMHRLSLKQAEHQQSYVHGSARSFFDTRKNQQVSQSQKMGASSGASLATKKLR